MQTYIVTIITIDEMGDEHKKRFKHVTFTNDSGIAYEVIHLLHSREENFDEMEIINISDLESL